MEYHNNKDYSYALGASITLEGLLKKPDKIIKVVFSSKAIKNSQFDKIVKLCNKYHIILEENDKLIDKLSIKENCYCIGFFKKFKNSLSCNNHLVLTDIENIETLGTIFRTAVSFNIFDIVLINCNLDYFNPACIRSSMGSIFHLNIENFKNLTQYQKQYKHNIYNFNDECKQTLDKITLIKPYALVFSNHGNDFGINHNNTYSIKQEAAIAISLSLLI